MQIALLKKRERGSKPKKGSIYNGIELLMLQKKKKKVNDKVKYNLHL